MLEEVSFDIGRVYLPGDDAQDLKVYLFEVELHQELGYQLQALLFGLPSDGFDLVLHDLDRSFDELVLLFAVDKFEEEFVDQLVFPGILLNDVLNRVEDVYLIVVRHLVHRLGDLVEKLVQLALGAHSQQDGRCQR